MLAIFKLQVVYVSAPRELFTDARFFSKTANVLFLSTKKYAQQLQTVYPYVENITVQKRLPHSLSIAATGRIGRARLVSELGTLTVDGMGIVIPDFISTGADLVEVDCPFVAATPITKIVDQRMLFVLAFITKWQDQKNESITAVHCQEENPIIIIGPTEIVVDKNQDAALLVSSLQFLFKQFRIEGSRPQRIDMRFEKPVLIPKIQQSPVSTAASSFVD